MISGHDYNHGYGCMYVSMYVRMYVCIYVFFYVCMFNKVSNNKHRLRKPEDAIKTPAAVKGVTLPNKAPGGGTLAKAVTTPGQKVQRYDAGSAGRCKVVTEAPQDTRTPSPQLHVKSPA